MYINFWYVAAKSGDITFGAERPVKVQMLGQHFALWRDKKGQVQCISDTCSHRGGALGDGRIRGDCIECPYHGWTFSGAGDCVRLPSLGPDARIPDRTRVDAYPVQERYGLVHVFLGDLPAAERIPILPIPEYEDPAWRFINLTLEWKIDYKRAIENTIDPGHNEFTHPTHGFLGTKDDYRVEEIQLRDEPWGTGFINRMHAPTLAQRDMNEAAGRTGDKWIEGGAGTHGPHCSWTYIHPSDQAQMHGFAFHTPVHEQLDRIYVLFGRNFLADPKYDQTFENRAQFIAEQDRYVLEPVRPKLTPHDNNHEFMVPADKCVGRYRGYCRDWQERGWRIDVAKMRADYDRVAYAIPSPARREVKGWVLAPVPLCPRATAETAAKKARG
ncbi:MAG: aromatic ring-hydroxylating dioxygenase subunit alpha [Gammaproteobacteria bacterium]|nr:aromatic ring-hydroxylating dioxygenase subunit alpha [Gammaproteobacteria bacterium]